MTKLTFLHLIRTPEASYSNHDVLRKTFDHHFLAIDRSLEDKDGEVPEQESEQEDALEMQITALPEEHDVGLTYCKSAKHLHTCLLFAQ